MLRLAVRVRREDAELVLAELLELAPSGVEEVDIGEGEVEYAVYGPPGELPALPELEAAAGSALITVRSEEIADDWSERWRDFHRPLVLEGAPPGAGGADVALSLTVRPPWLPPSTSSIDLVIDPGLAFGTGAHATTRLCLELLLGLEASGSLLDLGCGSGVLAIAAARLGWRPVLAVDNDPAAVEAASNNAAINQVELEARRLDLRTDEVPRADTVAANLLRPLLLSYAAGLSNPPEQLIASGLLAHETDEVAEAFAVVGLEALERRTRSEWAALLLARR
jgi:ribosomal protein L11 methyltransferase